MNAKFIEINAAADYIGPGAIEVPLYQTEITDLVRRRGVFGQRIKQVPATGHPSRFFEERLDGVSAWQQVDVTGRNALDIALSSLSVEQRIAVKASLLRQDVIITEPKPPSKGKFEHSVPLKALVAQMNYNLFDLELGKQEQQEQFAFLQAKDLADTVDGVLRTHDIALWNGTDTSLSSPTTAQYYGVANQIAATGHTTKIAATESIVDGLKSTIAQMLANSQFGVGPTAIYANPVLLDLIDREMKAEFNVVLNTKPIEGGLTVKTLSTQAGDIPLIPEWTLPYTGTPGSGSAVLPAYIVTEDLIEYHWLSDVNPRIFQLGRPGSLASQYVVVKFGAVVVKGGSHAHHQVLVDR